jgi:hypothetical protein
MARYSEGKGAVREGIARTGGVCITVKQIAGLSVLPPLVTMGDNNREKQE